MLCQTEQRCRIDGDVQHRQPAVLLGRAAGSEVAVDHVTKAGKLALVRRATEAALCLCDVRVEGPAECRGDLERPAQVERARPIGVRCVLDSAVRSGGPGSALEVRSLLGDPAANRGAKQRHVLPSGAQETALLDLAHPRGRQLARLLGEVARLLVGDITSSHRLGRGGQSGVEVAGEADHPIRGIHAGLGRDADIVSDEVGIGPSVPGPIASADAIAALASVAVSSNR